MLTRRSFLSLSAAGLALPVLPSLALARGGTGAVALYVNVGAVLVHFEVDVAGAQLVRRGSLTLPAAIQYAWPHASGRVLYVVSSDWASRHFLTALSIDPHSGELAPHGESVALPVRPINVTTDVPSAYVLVAFSAPSGVRVFRVNHDLGVGVEVPEPGVSDGGIFAHQIRVTPDNRHAILVTRGNSATAKAPEDPGALKMFDYREGVLSNEASIAPDGGMGFGPRHLDFHPHKPWVYVSLERESRLFTYRLDKGRLEAQPAFRAPTVSDPDHMTPRQLAGAIHVHPNGRFVYVANRADGTVDFNGKKVFAGGENSIAVFAIDQRTGEPKAIQHIDTHKVYPRTFHIDPSGRMLVAEHNLPVWFRDGDDVRLVPAGMTVFRIADDGTLAYQRVVDVEVTGDDSLFWMGMVRL
jgi:6-phosphogluconolactonase (cycloisomerase 2 family)